MSSAALFGGSFDPPHIGHMKIVERLKELSYIDEIIIMPTYLNPFKKSFHAAPEKRLEWLQRIFENDPKVTISDFEVRQRKRVPTILSVEELHKRFDRVYVVIGADNLESLHEWHRFEELEKRARFIVFSRNGKKVKDTEFIHLELDIPVSSSALRKEMDKKLLPPLMAEEIYNYYKEKS